MSADLINACMRQLMADVRRQICPARSTAREHIAESRQKRAQDALQRWRKAGRMPPFSGRSRQPRGGDNAVCIFLNLFWADKATVRHEPEGMHACADAAHGKPDKFIHFNFPSCRSRNQHDSRGWGSVKAIPATVTA